MNIKYIERRAITTALFLIENSKYTIRELAIMTGLCRSTIHNDLTKHLPTGHIRNSVEHILQNRSPSNQYIDKARRGVYPKVDNGLGYSLSKLFGNPVVVTRAKQYGFLYSVAVDGTVLGLILDSELDAVKSYIDSLYSEISGKYNIRNGDYVISFDGSRLVVHGDFGTRDEVAFLNIMEGMACVEQGMILMNMHWEVL